MSSYKQTTYFLLPPFHPSLFVFLAFNLLVCMVKNENAFTLLNLHRKRECSVRISDWGLTTISQLCLSLGHRNTTKELFSKCYSIIQSLRLSIRI